MKKIVVISTQKTQPTILNSDATNLAGLKSSLGFLGDLSQMRIVVKETKQTLEFDDSVLPEGDFTLFVSPKNIKAGAQDIIAVLERLKEKFTSKVGEAFDELIEAVEEGEFEVEGSTPTPVASSVVISREDQSFLEQMKGMH